MKVSNKELLDIIINIERKAQAFYEELANHVSEPMISNYLLLMAKDEAHHETQFEAILGKEECKKYGWEDSSALREFIDKNLKPGLFPPLEGVLENLSKFEGVRKALTISLKCEEIAVEFFRTLRDCCEDFETQTILIPLESEEKLHCDYIQVLIKYWEKQPS